MNSADNVYRGQITRITTAGVFVIVPKLGAGVEYGPCSRLVGSGGTFYQQGTQVLVATINGVPDDLVVLGPLG